VVALEQVVQEISLFDIFIECSGANFAGERVFDISVLCSTQQLFDLLFFAVFWKLVSGMVSQGLPDALVVAVINYSRTLSACNDSSVIFGAYNKICL
jgi:hypothetical protein